MNVRPETINHIEENLGGKLLDIDFGKDFLNLTPKAKAIKTNIKWDYIKLKGFSAQQRKPSQNEKAACGMGESNCKPHVQ